MDISREFDQWAIAGRDRGMEDRHWHTAKHALAEMPVESGQSVLDLGTGSGYALRALNDTTGLERGIGIDAAPQMVRNARTYTDADSIEFIQGAFEELPLGSDAVDHAFSMEAFYYARDPDTVLDELHRVIKPGGTFYCGVNFFEESEETHRWQDRFDIEMILWDRQAYREAFRRAGFEVAAQRCIPDEETEIPPESEFPDGEFDSREAMIDRFRRWGTLLTVGVATSDTP